MFLLLLLEAYVADARDASVVAANAVAPLLVLVLIIAKIAALADTFASHVDVADVAFVV